MALVTQSDILPASRIVQANQRLEGIVLRTPLVENLLFSENYEARILFKREDLQVVRSYKLRGAYNKMCQLSDSAKKKGIVCASAGNHAQGVAYSCYSLKISGKIYVPQTTPRQKVDKVKLFGKEYVEVILMGDTFDDAYKAAKEESSISGRNFIHPFDDEEIIAGQGTVGLEIIADNQKVDYLFLPIGGGGLSAGVGSYFKQLSPHTQIIGVEPEGAPAMKASLDAGKRTFLPTIDKFVDGAAVKEVGEHTFKICQHVLDDIILVPEGKVCTTILQLYNEEAIVVEPAGALTLAALDYYKEQIKGKTVVCLLSGGNNDITRMEEIKERSLIHERLKLYFLIKFPQRAGALREFLVQVLGPKDDISRFEYTKRNNRSSGPALVGVELEKKEDYQQLLDRMEAHDIDYQLINDDPMLFNMLV